MNNTCLMAELLQGFPRGQRGRTQDPLLSASQVQILSPAPTRTPSPTPERCHYEL